MDPEALPKAVEWYVNFARLAEKRDAELGHPAENAPTAADLWSLAETTNEMFAGEARRTPAEIWGYMQNLAAISDKWTDPENDLIGAQLYPVIEETIFNLQIILNEALPESTEDRQRWANLRAAKHGIARRVYLDSLHPSPGKRVWKRLFGG